MTLELHQIDKALARFPGFLGTFPIDKIPKKIKPGQGLVANFETQEQGGSHWVCCYYFKHPRNLVYFDSFGFPPPKRILKMLKRSAPCSYFSLPDFQEYHSNECGMFCIDFLAHAFTGETPTGVLRRNFIMHPSHKNEVSAKKIYEELE